MLAKVQAAYRTTFAIANTIWVAMVSTVGITPAMFSAAFFSPSRLLKAAHRASISVDILGWLPDGERLLLQTYPSGGRRLILVDGVAETAVDLSRPRWDALFTLHPDGETLLLSNGRGSFGRSQLE